MTLSHNLLTYSYSTWLAGSGCDVRMVFVVVCYSCVQNPHFLLLFVIHVCRTHIFCCCLLFMCAEPTFFVVVCYSCVQNPHFLLLFVIHVCRTHICCCCLLFKYAEPTLKKKSLLFMCAEPNFYIFFVCYLCVQNPLFFFFIVVIHVRRTHICL